jgi:hypothetical protein
MAIIDTGIQNRKTVVWWNQEPPIEAANALQARGYAAIKCSETDLSANDFIAGVSTVVFVANIKISRFQKVIEKHLKRLLNFDCHVVIFANRTSIKSVKNIFAQLEIEAFNIDLFEPSLSVSKSLPAQPYVRVWPLDVEMDWNDFANLIVQIMSDLAPNLATKIQTSDPSLINIADEILIRRAFFDCNRVQLQPLSGGKSGARVFKAFSELNDQPKQWPQAHFVKIDTRSNIHTEYKKYVQKVSAYIPFHLGPHLFRERCCLGAEIGIIVGNFVEDAEDLHHCASDGRATAAIACLFDRTLIGWHRQASRKPGSIAEILLPRIPMEIPPRRMEIAAGLGSKMGLAQMKVLFARCCCSPVLLGPVHGDLHCANVMVRGTDAILIDFSSHEDDQLILLDAASLEASLLIDGFASYSDSIEKLLLSIKVLYGSDLFDRTSLQANPGDPFYWFHTCIHQVRLHARQWEISANQYAAVLAFALLKKASKDPTIEGPEDERRACAYLLAEKILSETFGP